jgi:hypothetical protein
LTCIVLLISLSETPAHWALHGKALDFKCAQQKQSIMGDRHAGGCQRGQLRYEVVGQPAKAVVGHCRDCQTRTGSAFGVSAYFPRDKVTVTGPTKDYSFTTESGRSFTTHFCPNCGSNVLWSIGLTPDLIGVAAGSFDPSSSWFPLSRAICAHRPGQEIRN